MSGAIVTSAGLPQYLAKTRGTGIFALPRHRVHFALDTSTDGGICHDSTSSQPFGRLSTTSSTFTINSCRPGHWRSESLRLHPRAKIHSNAPIHSPSAIQTRHNCLCVLLVYFCSVDKIIVGGTSDWRPMPGSDLDDSFTNDVNLDNLDLSGTDLLASPLAIPHARGGSPSLSVQMNGLFDDDELGSFNTFQEPCRDGGDSHQPDCGGPGHYAYNNRFQLPRTGFTDRKC